ncbi:MAG: formyltetrahydrofolate deformylase [SAR324 cluster bacterium]|nr:formyltetrahydrofolate deformylase [SAR324 cluster bacterium]
MHDNTTARLLITCPDCPGIVASVSNFFYNHGANITALDQHSTDPEGGTFFMRVEFQTPHLDISRPVLSQAFSQAVAERYQMDWEISYASDHKKMVIFVSKYDHVLLELLWRWSRHELPTDISMVISNHGDLKQSVESFGVPFYEIPVSRNNKEDAEKQALEMLAGKTDLIILARYMQILTDRFVEQYENRIINIHHSFLPAFVGADPYRQAYEKGVKLIGATAHYVTAELDKGPIIEQDVNRVSHRYKRDHLRQLGQDIERNVLFRAVKWHLEDRIIVYKNRTIVFV